MIFHRWLFIKTCLFGNFQGLYERSMGSGALSMEPEPLVYLTTPLEIVLGSYVI